MTVGAPKLILGLLVMWLAVPLVFYAWGRSDDDARSPVSQEVSSGFYPPAPSKAVGMTPEWAEFAAAVDRICGTSFNRALVIEDRVKQFAIRHGWNVSRTEKALLGVWNEQALTILRSTEALGEPPERRDLFMRWRANVAKRATLRRRAARAASEERWTDYNDGMSRIFAMKDRSDEIGQRFGLRICTSN